VGVEIELDEGAIAEIGTDTTGIEEEVYGFLILVVFGATGVTCGDAIVGGGGGGIDAGAGILQLLYMARPRVYGFTSAPVRI
jgi:hypothetical protein